MKYNEEQFKGLLKALSDDLLNARHHFKLYRSLREALDDYQKEINQCVAFWGLTLSAHKQASILNLCRAYDPQKDASSLRQLIQIIQKNIDLFDIQQFRERLKHNPYVDSLSQTAREPSKQQLEKDLEFVSKDNPLVKRLIILRNNVVAHTSTSSIIKSKNDLNPLTWEEIEELIEQGMSIVNSYSSLFEASTYASTLIGEDDYKTVLRHIRCGIKATKFLHEIEEEWYKR
ncbi:MAG: hypothetical protein NT070_23065 [Cyanobacteria bacterium]|nr:hypothetical protein [Cyanobacteriota bacterium]